jgi:hypothetical protein
LACCVRPPLFLTWPPALAHTASAGVSRPFSRIIGRIEGTYPAVDICRMAKKPELPKPISWNVYKIASKAVWLGEVEAPGEAAAIEKAAAEFKVPATKLMAIRR